MRSVPALLLVAVIALGVAEDTTTDDKLNTVEPRTSERLDPYIRKALLKALSELEDNENLNTGTDTTDSTSTAESEIFKTSREITETFPTEAGKQRIQIHSFVVNGQSAFYNNTNTTPMLVENNISILSTTAGNVENQVTATLPTQTPLNEIFETKETGINYQQVRSIHNTLNYDNSINIKDATTKPIPSTTTTTTTTTTSTTTTTPKPTHNTDGENIEDVDKRDVQVFQAPLVAAFTVHQDALGLPKKVVPIYQHTNAREVVKHPSDNLPTGVLPSEITRQALPLQNTDVNKIPQNDFINQQLTLQRQLEEKQRILEEQLRLLQIQQRQQEELLRKQQILLQQKEAQRQQQLLFEQEQLKRQQLITEQQRLQANYAVNNFQLQGLQKINQNQSPNHLRQQNTQVSIQSSLPLEPISSVNPATQQQLPHREAVDFLINLRNQQPEQFPLQENHLPQGISNFLQSGPIQNFPQGSNFNQIRSLDDHFRQKQGNRVFRQENGVGNFGLNNQNYNRFNTFNPIYSNRYFSNRQNQFNPDTELKQLLAQNGLNGRAHEDLNIVSKVLSLNHGIPLNNNISNRLPFDSRRHVRTPL